MERWVKEPDAQNPTALIIPQKAAGANVGTEVIYIHMGKRLNFRYLKMINILPINDLQEHVEDTTCSCNPSIIEESGELTVIHNSFDGREGLELANETLNGS